MGRIEGGLGDQRRKRRILPCRKGAIDDLCGVGAAGKDDSSHPGVRGQQATQRGAIARQQLDHIAGHAGLKQQFDHPMRHDRGLLGGFGKDGIAVIPARDGRIRNAVAGPGA